MNEILNLRRFGLFFKKLLFEQPLVTFGLLATMLIGTFILYRPYNLNGNNFTDGEDILLPALVSGGCGIVFSVIGHFSESAKGYQYLLTPSSYFEKWLNTLLITVFFLGIYLAFFKILDTYNVKIFHEELAQVKDMSVQTKEYYRNRTQVVNYSGSFMKNTLALFFILTGMTALGCLYFNKNAFVKTLLAIACCYVGFIFLSYQIKNYFFDEIGSGGTLYRTYVRKGGMVNLDETYANMLDFGFYFGLPTALWLIALIRLREKEI